MIYAACFIGGCIIGFVGAIIIGRIRSGFGSLKINRSDPTRDVYRLEVNDDLDKLQYKKYLILRVKEDE